MSKCLKMQPIPLSRGQMLITRLAQPTCNLLLLFCCCSTMTATGCCCWPLLSEVDERSIASSPDWPDTPSLRWANMRKYVWFNSSFVHLGDVVVEMGRVTSVAAKPVSSTRGMSIWLRTFLSGCFGASLC